MPWSITTQLPSRNNGSARTTVPVFAARIRVPLSPPKSTPAWYPTPARLFLRMPNSPPFETRGRRTGYQNDSTQRGAREAPNTARAIFSLSRPIRSVSRADNMGRFTRASGNFFAIISTVAISVVTSPSGHLLVTTMVAVPEAAATSIPANATRSSPPTLVVASACPLNVALSNVEVPSSPMAIMNMSPGDALGGAIMPTACAPCTNVHKARIAKMPANNAFILLCSFQRTALLRVHIWRTKIKNCQVCDSFSENPARASYRHQLPRVRPAEYAPNTPRHASGNDPSVNAHKTIRSDIPSARPGIQDFMSAPSTKN